VDTADGKGKVVSNIRSCKGKFGVLDMTHCVGNHFGIINSDFRESSLYRFTYFTR